MSIDYTIKAYPTLYRGRQYRSRLEARWAAFFDLLGWQHEYEPFDLGAWSPDFGMSLAVPWTPLDRILVEVKPYVPFVGDKPTETVNKMIGAAAERGLLGKSAFLLLGTSPIIDPRDSRFVCIGIMWFPEDAGNPVKWVWNSARIGWFPDPAKPQMFADIVPSCHWEDDGGPEMAYPCLRDVCLHRMDVEGYALPTMELWAQATNAVQYQHGVRS